jgi:hypothetical protein
VRFVVDDSGPFAAGPNATAVGINIRARVGILPHSGTYGTTNLGVSRVGGGTPSFRITAVDPAGGPDRGRFERGLTGDVGPNGQPLLDINAAPLAGAFRHFRGFFAPGTPPYLGSNNDRSNGALFSSHTDHDPYLTNVVGSRGFGYNNDPVGAAETPTSTGPALLVGSLANVHRMIYIVRPVAQGESNPGDRHITINVTGLGVRYLYAISPQYFAAPAVILPNRSFTFQVPTIAADADARTAATHRAPHPPRRARMTNAGGRFRHTTGVCSTSAKYSGNSRAKRRPAGITRPIW